MPFSGYLFEAIELIQSLPQVRDSLTLITIVSKNSFANYWI